MIVYLLSPASTVSEVCGWEIEVAERLGKKIIPVVIAEPSHAPPGRVGNLNYLFWRPAGSVEPALTLLLDAINTDIGWLREHARIGQRAHRWQQRGRPEGELMRGKDLSDALVWSAAATPEQLRAALTSEITDYLAASRNESSYESRFTYRAYVQRHVLSLLAGLAVLWLIVKYGRRLLG